MEALTVVLADDHNIVRNGIKSLIDGVDGIKVIGEAENGAEAVALVKELKPLLLLADINMPLLTGIKVAETLSIEAPYTKVLILSMHDNEEYILKSVESGASGYLLKDTGKAELIKAIKTVAAGEKYYSTSVSGIIAKGYLHRINGPVAGVKTEKPLLSKKERNVLTYIVEGLKSKDIADKLNLSVRTVDNHRANMMRKLNVKNAAELVRTALDKQLIRL